MVNDLLPVLIVFTFMAYFWPFIAIFHYMFNPVLEYILKMHIIMSKVSMVSYVTLDVGMLGQNITDKIADKIVLDKLTDKIADKIPPTKSLRESPVRRRG